MYQCSSNCFDRTSSTSTEQWPFTPALLWVVHHWPTLGTQTHLPWEPVLEKTQSLCFIDKASTSVCARHSQHINISPAPVFLCWLTGSWDYFLPLLWGSPALKRTPQLNSTASYFPRLGLSSKSELISKCGFRKCFIGYQNKMWLTTLELCAMRVSKETTVSPVPKVCGSLTKLYTYKFSM